MFPGLIPSIKRLVLESGRPVPRQVATSITLPSAILPITNFWPSGKSITNGESEIGSGSCETFAGCGVVSFFLAIR